MITGFGNNTVSALASDITATQTTFSVIPGAGEKFEQLLTTDNVNAGSPHGVYAKLTLTDSQGTVFEICHLTKVAGDSLTVIRGQEGTAAKGWSLNDVVANFATRGSEESFVQIEQLQGGDFTSATAGGTPNALTISLPSTYQNNASSDWALKTPLMIMPIAANTGAVTIQVALAGKVVGTFPAYKGNKGQLEKGDILAGVPFICAMDTTKAYFTVINPVNIYGALLRENNLSDVANAEAARNNIGALAVSGGDVGYLDNAKHYKIKPGSWEGAGSFASQYSNPASPFLIPYGYVAPQDVSSYAPIIKGVVQTKTYGYGTAVSFGALTAGNATFAQACIHAIGDNGTSVIWYFNPNTSTFSCPGDVYASGNVNCNGLYNTFVNTGRLFVNSQPNPGAGQGTHLGWNETNGQGESDFINNRGGGSGGFRFRIVNTDNTVETGSVFISGTGDLTAKGNLSTSSGGVYEQGQRVYSPNNPPPQPDLSGYATITWANVDLRNDIYNWCRQSFITGQRQSTATWAGARVGGGLTVPDGCVWIGARNNGSSDVANMGVQYCYEQVCINGVWQNIGRV